MFEKIKRYFWGEPKTPKTKIEKNTLDILKEEKSKRKIKSNIETFLENQAKANIAAESIQKEKPVTSKYRSIDEPWQD